MDDSARQTRHGAKAGKVGYKKSRKGCLRCKSRRVKCDETRPMCRNCSRLVLDCTWADSPSTRPTPTPPGAAAQSGSSSTDPGDGAASGDGSAPSSQAERFFGALRPRTGQQIFPAALGASDDEDVEIPESRERRLLEHRLMQNHADNLSQPFPVSPNHKWQHLFCRVMPALALTHDNLLYAIMTLSATHLLRTEPENMQLFDTRQRYLILAMREQRRMVAKLDAATADPVCFASLLLLINSFAMLRERPLEPYTPPLEWIHIGRGAATLIWMSVKAACESEDFANSHMHTIATSYPNFGDDRSYFDPDMRRALEGILTQAIPCEDVWDDETKEAYEKTLSYVGSVQNAIHKNEPVYTICRRIQGFTLLMPAKFIVFLQERRPRALVILAHFFATVAQVHGVWWLREDGDGGESTARREIRAIGEVLPEAWRGQIVWPLDIVGLR